MILSDIVEVCKARLKNIAQAHNAEYLSRIVNMGISDLYNRFNLKVGSEAIATSRSLPVYEVRDPAIQMLITLYRQDGTELVQSDVLDSKKWEWKQVNYRSFLLNNPTDGHIIAAYKSEPEPVTQMDSPIELPSSFIEALVMYVVYMTSSTLTSQATATGFRQGNEAQIYRQMYEAECERLIMMGYKVNLQTERPAIQLRGFV